MIFFTFIFISFIVNDENVDDLAKKSFNVPVFILFHSPFCGHCKKIFPIFELFQKQMDSDNEIIVASLDCLNNQYASKYFINVNSYPTFAIIRDNETTITGVDRDFNSWLKLADKLKSFNPNDKCNIWLDQVGNYPFFVYFSPKDPEKTCDEIQHLLLAVNDSRVTIYSYPNYNNYACQVNLDRTTALMYDDQKNNDNFIAFIKEHKYLSLGNWSLNEAIYSTRRIGFLIYNDQRQVNKLHDIAINQSIDLLIGKLPYHDFTKMYPKIPLNQSELPALAVANGIKTRFKIIPNFSDEEKMYNILANIINGEEDSSMKYSMDRVLELSGDFLSDYERKRNYSSSFDNSLSPIVVISLILIALILLFLLTRFKNRAPTKSRNQILLLSFTNLKNWINGKLKKNEDIKIPISLL